MFCSVRFSECFSTSCGRVVEELTSLPVVQFGVSHSIVQVPVGMSVTCWLFVLVAGVAVESLAPAAGFTLVEFMLYNSCTCTWKYFLCW